MNSGNQHFDSLVESGKPVGEVVAVDNFLVRIKGMQPCNLHSLVMFEDGSKGFVNKIGDKFVDVLHIGNESLDVGMVAVLQHTELVCKVGKDFIGRVVNIMGEPLDGKGPIAADAAWPVFHSAPPLHERRLLDTQLESGVVVVDSLFPIARGQRMALLGDSKSGKSSLVTQLTINQANTDQVVVYSMIAKRKSDIDALLIKLEQTGAIKKAIVVVSTMFESLISSYLAPYVACAMAEYLWRKLAQDTIVIYDDLTSHAHAYREVALLSGSSPGRDSYPGDMFYAHSSLLERAGRLETNGAHLTSIPIVNVPAGDITTYLPTNIMSITDGQWILDMDIFRSGIRPAINIGQSVTRVGGLAHNKRQKSLASKSLKILSDYRQAQEFSHFGNELALETKKSLQKGEQILQILTQPTTETYNLTAQQLMLDLILGTEDPSLLDVSSLKLSVRDVSKNVASDDQYQEALNHLKQKTAIEVKKV